ncbi:uncharacterized protein LOC119087622 isoform X2 [Peromyscus leucopus]|uniref:uncharacterized protein LOC119087622 isoform X2 n=1 Tax=Peromyscus leucopus TaxID=10041 RepID=UPI0018856FCF|nr:uncharacterized protein LOC119087622 isoform X2 [Peromyscus leucopus]
MSRKIKDCLEQPKAGKEVFICPKMAVSNLESSSQHELKIKYTRTASLDIYNHAGLHSNHWCLYVPASGFCSAKNIVNKKKSSIKELPAYSRSNHQSEVATWVKEQNHLETRSSGSHLSHLPCEVRPSVHTINHLDQCHQPLKSSAAPAIHSVCHICALLLNAPGTAHCTFRNQLIAVVSTFPRMISYAGSHSLPHCENSPALPGRWSQGLWYWALCESSHSMESLLLSLE